LIALCEGKDTCTLVQSKCIKDGDYTTFLTNSHFKDVGSSSDILCVPCCNDDYFKYSSRSSSYTDKYMSSMCTCDKIITAATFIGCSYYAGLGHDMLRLQGRKQN